METKIYNINDIMKILPHRYPFLLIDKVEVVEAGVKGTGFKNVTINEPFFQGHFPGNPIMPGVLQIEAMAQTAGFVIASASDELKRASVLFMGVDKVKFRRQVLPGDVLKICTEKVKQRRNIYVCKAEIYVCDQLVSEAELTAMVSL